MPGSARLARVGEINTAMTTFLHGIHTQSLTYTAGAQGLLATTGEAADRASAIIASFQDNPARRLAALVLGDEHRRAASPRGWGSTCSRRPWWGPTGARRPAAPRRRHVRRLLTGVVIGLGSAPTHEVVKSLQTYKDGRTAPSSVATMVTDVSGFAVAGADQAGGDEGGVRAGRDRTDGGPARPQRPANGLGGGGHMRIVLVHGRAAQMEIPAVMEADMTRALAFGQARINDGLDPASLDVHLSRSTGTSGAPTSPAAPVIEPADEAEEAFPGSATSRSGSTSAWASATS